MKNKATDIKYEFGFLEFDLKDFTFTDPMNNKRKTGGLHISINERGIRGYKLDECFNKKCLFPHPHIELYGHVNTLSKELNSLFEHDKKIVKKCSCEYNKVVLETGCSFKLPPLPIENLIRERETDSVVNMIIEDLSKYDESTAYTCFCRYPKLRN
ncbi:MAG: hypothetical protein GY861_22170 [bacterium]|nr:hypothetical protein [bacterium]